MRFVGRKRSLATLKALYDDVAQSGRGTMVAVRGRRQVGKSRLYTEFVARNQLPHVFFTAVKNAPLTLEMDAFRRAARDAVPPLPEADALFGDAPQNWSAVFARLGLAAKSGPIVVILDEFPWACDASPTLEGELQNAWDRQLQHLPVLLMLVGSDVAMMARLTEHDRPLYGRAREDVVRPFDPAEIAEALGLAHANATTAFDGYLVTGGYPKLVDDFVRAGSTRAYLTRGIEDENTNLVVMAQRSLDAEFPPDAQARHVLSAIGANDIGHTTFSTVVALLGDDPANAGVALTRSLRILGEQKGVLAIEHPARARPGSRQRRYRVDDPYLRFWFRFIQPHVANIARGRSDVALNSFDISWSAWRGIAVEPVVRQAVLRMAPSVDALMDATDVGPWWNRDNSVEVDVVATSRSAVLALGSIKWRERKKFSPADLAELAAARAVVPDAGAAGLVAIAPAGADATVRADVVLTAGDLLSAWG